MWSWVKKGGGIKQKQTKENLTDTDNPVVTTRGKRRVVEEDERGSMLTGRDWTLGDEHTEGRCITELYTTYIILLTNVTLINSIQFFKNEGLCCSQG